MPAVMRTFFAADAAPSPAEAAVERLRVIEPRWRPETVRACACCSSTAITFEAAEYETGVFGEVMADAGYHCKSCGAFEPECDEIVVMPAASFVAMTAEIRRPRRGYRPPSRTSFAPRRRAA
jgi:hypothetical protein